MKINGLNDLLKGVKLEEAAHNPSLPSQRATPRPEKSKVISNPVRLPMTKQAAMLLQPVRCWLSQPLPDPLEKVNRCELAKVQAELKIERNEHAMTRDQVGMLRATVRALRGSLERHREEIAHLQRSCADKDKTIRQLEDIKL